MNIIVCKISFCFLSLLTALIIKNSRILAEIYFILLRKRPRPNLKGFQYQTWTSVNRAEKQLSSKTNLSAFIANYLLKCQVKSSVKGLRFTKIVKQIKLEGVLGQVRSKKMFPETIIHRVIETNSSSHVKQCTMGKVQFLFF